MRLDRLSPVVVMVLLALSTFAGVCDGTSTTAPDGDTDATDTADGDDEAALEDEDVPVDGDVDGDEDILACTATSDCPTDYICFLAEGRCIPDPRADGDAETDGDATEPDEAIDEPADTVDTVDPEPEAADEEPADETDHVEYDIQDFGYRITHLVWEYPALHNFTIPQLGQTIDLNAVLNDQANQRIANGQFHLLFAPTVEDVRAYPYVCAIGQGEVNPDGSYSIEVVEQVDFTFDQDPDEDSDAYCRSDPRDFDVPMPGIGGSGYDFTLRGMIVTGHWSDGNLTVAGRMAGAMLRSDAQGVVLYGMLTLDSIIDTARNLPGNEVIEVNACPGEAEPCPAWVFTFTYDAERVRFP